MRIKVFKAPTMSEAMANVKAELGDDAVILHTKRYRKGGLMGFRSKEIVEIIAAVEDQPVNERINIATAGRQENTESRLNITSQPDDIAEYGKLLQTEPELPKAEEKTIEPATVTVRPPLSMVNQYQNASRRTTQKKADEAEKTPTTLDDVVEQIRQQQNKAYDARTIAEKEEKEELERQKSVVQETKAPVFDNFPEYADIPEYDYPAPPDTDYPLPDYDSYYAPVAEFSPSSAKTQEKPAVSEDVKESIEPFMPESVIAENNVSAENNAAVEDNIDDTFEKNQVEQSEENMENHQADFIKTTEAENSENTENADVNANEEDKEADLNKEVLEEATEEKIEETAVMAEDNAVDAEQESEPEPEVKPEPKPKKKTAKKAVKVEAAEDSVEEQLSINPEDDGKDLRIQQLQDELAQMKEMLSQAMKTDKDENKVVNLQSILRQNDVEDKVIQDMISRLNGSEIVADKNSSKAVTAFERYLRRTVRVANGITLFSSRPKVVALIGATGVGKTTTLAKIAAKFVLEQGISAAMITADTYRISAVEQLKTYSDIIGLPLEIVYSPDALKKAIDKHKNKQLILIDTAGRSQYNEYQMKELCDLLAVDSSIEKHLVMSATTKNRDAEEILEHFSVCKPDRIIFTKTDETSCSGIILNMLHKRKIALSYLTNGQSVPDDIYPASIEKLAELLLR